MPQIKIASFNVEWMAGLFGGRWKDWDGHIPATFAGRKLGDIRLEAIADVPALCRRIAGVIRDVGAQIIGIQEGPPLAAQMQLFVDEYLDGDYTVFASNSRWQTIYALVHRSIRDRVSAFAPDDPQVELLSGNIPFYPWGAVDKPKKHEFYRVPLVLTFQPRPGEKLRLIVVHTKSKYSKLKTKEQWLARDQEAIMDALLARQKLSAEVYRLREYIAADLADDDAPDGLIVMGDMNDGPYAELIEREFLVHNIVDELIGSLLEPDRFLKHAMSPAVLAQAATTSFPDPLQDGQTVEELIDHLLVSAQIWWKRKPFKLKPNSCRVESEAFERYNDDHGPQRQRGLRPSDHRPVSAVIAYG